MTRKRMIVIINDNPQLAGFSATAGSLPQFPHDESI